MFIVIISIFIGGGLEQIFFKLTEKISKLLCQRKDTHNLWHTTHITTWNSFNSIPAEFAPLSFTLWISVLFGSLPSQRSFVSYRCLTHFSLISFFFGLPIFMHGMRTHMVILLNSHKTHSYTHAHKHTHSHQCVRDLCCVLLPSIQQQQKKRHKHLKYMQIKSKKQKKNVLSTEDDLNRKGTFHICVHLSTHHVGCTRLFSCFQRTFHVHFQIEDHHHRRHHHSISTISILALPMSKLSSQYGACVQFYYVFVSVAKVYIFMTSASSVPYWMVVVALLLLKNSIIPTTDYIQ